MATAGGWQKGLRSLVRDHTVRDLKDFFLPAMISQFHKPRVSTPDEVSLITPVAARVWGLRGAGAGLQAGTQTSLVFLDRLV